MNDCPECMALEEKVEALTAKNDIAIKALEDIWVHTPNDQADIAANALNRIKPLAPNREKR